MKRGMTFLFLGAILALACQKTVTGPSPTPSNDPPAVVSPAAVVGTPHVVGDSWTMNGVTVTVLSDEWGSTSSSCHTQGGARTLRLDAKTGVYSRRACYFSNDKGCGPVGPPSLEGKPTMIGPEAVDAGKSITVTYRIEPPSCGRRQCDDTWGPNPGTFVIGDVFDSGRDCPRPTPTPTPTPTPSPTPTPCIDKPYYTGEFSVDSLSNAGTYFIMDGSTKWKDNLVLPAGTNVASYPHDLTGTNLCLWYQTEKIGCAVASCNPTASWHGTVSFDCTLHHTCEVPK